MKSSAIDAKRDLIQNIIFGVSQSGAFQRNKIYCVKLNQKEAKQFRQYLKTKLADLLSRIKSKPNYSDNDHYRAIVRFSKEVSGEKHHCLENGRLTIGTAQKLINLYWKMSWLLQKEIPVPIHCPFDGIIIKGLGKALCNIKWTKMDSIDTYKLLVTAAKVKSKGRCIADWELVHYNIGNSIGQI